MFKEFKEFALRGNMLDMAIGIIVGTAFGKIIASAVNDIIMPPIGLILGRVDFSNLFIDLSGQSYRTLQQAKEAGAPTLNYGLFINTALDFLIIAFTIFIVVRQMNRLKRREEPAAPTTKECPYCLSAIALKAVRCPHCTSELKARPAPAAAESL